MGNLGKKPANLGRSGARALALEGQEVVTSGADGFRWDLTHGPIVSAGLFATRGFIVGDLERDVA